MPAKSYPFRSASGYHRNWKTLRGVDEAIISQEEAAMLLKFEITTTMKFKRESWLNNWLWTLIVRNMTETLYDILNSLKIWEYVTRKVVDV